MQDGRATVTKSTFAYECRVTVDIKAPADTIWKIMTDGPNVTKWNSTILGVDGVIGLHQHIRIKTVLDPSRSFRLFVSEFEPPRRMVWTDGMAPFYKSNRITELADNGDGTTHYTFSQDVRGLLFPLIAGAMPNFPTMCEQLARELKAAAEAP